MWSRENERSMCDELGAGCHRGAPLLGGLRAECRSRTLIGQPTQGERHQNGAHTVRPLGVPTSFFHRTSTPGWRGAGRPLLRSASGSSTRRTIALDQKGIGVVGVQINCCLGSGDDLGYPAQRHFLGTRRTGGMDQKAMGVGVLINCFVMHTPRLRASPRIAYGRDRQCARIRHWIYPYEYHISEFLRFHRRASWPI